MLTTPLSEIVLELRASLKKLTCTYTSPVTSCAKLVLNLRKRSLIRAKSLINGQMFTLASAALRTSTASAARTKR